MIQFDEHISDGLVEPPTRITSGNSSHKAEIKDFMKNQKKTKKNQTKKTKEKRIKLKIQKKQKIIQKNLKIIKKSKK